MTIPEAERASEEMLLTNSKETEAEHYKRLCKALEALDIKELSDLLDQAEKELDSKSKP